MQRVLETGDYFGKLLSKKQLPQVILSETNYSPYTHVPNHYHKNFYICYVVNGQYSETNNKTKRDCVRGDIVIHPKHLEHSNIFNDKGGTCFNIEFTDSLQKEIHAFNNNNFRRFSNKSTLLAAVIQKIYKEFKAYDEFSSIIIEGLLLETIGYSARESDKGLSPYWFNKVKAIIVENNFCKISLSPIAAELNISPSHLAREFKKVTGVSIGEYIQNFKIQLACGRLKEGYNDILNIALEFGFSDQSHFTKVFRKIVGITPKQYQLINK